MLKTPQPQEAPRPSSCRRHGTVSCAVSNVRGRPHPARSGTSIKRHNPVITRLYRLLGLRGCTGVPLSYSALDSLVGGDMAIYVCVFMGLCCYVDRLLRAYTISVLSYYFNGCFFNY